MSDPKYDVAFVYREPATNGDPRRTTGWGGPGFYVLDVGYPYHMHGPFESEGLSAEWGEPFLVYPTTAEDARIEAWEREQDALAEANQ